jgi:hypothetical protein
LTNPLRPNDRRRLLTLVIFGCSLVIQPCGLAQTLLASASGLIDAPQPQPPANQVEPSGKQITFAPPAQARKYAQVIEPGQSAYAFSASNKMVFSFTEVVRPITILPSVYSAAYEHLFESDPKYGHDAGAFGEQFGASMLRRASVRVLADGVFAAAFHQDPRYYRIASGSILHRSLIAARGAIIRRGDNGSNQFNYSGIVGRAVSAALTVGYYPEPSINASVIGSTFATSIATDAGGNLLLEFLPNVIHKFPIMRKLLLE